MKPQGQSGLHIRSRRGAASVLIILLLVLLIFFGILALLAAATDLRMAVRRSEWNQGFYEADSQAEWILAMMDQASRQPGFSSAELSRQAAILAEQLQDQPLVLEFSVRPDAGKIRVETRIAAGQDAGHGMDLVLLVQPAEDAAEGLVIDIIRWSWWRTPFDYDQHPGGIWEG